jgi:hypothetical protein
MKCISTRWEMIWLKRVRLGVEAGIIPVPRSLIDVEIYFQILTVICNEPGFVFQIAQV